MKVKRWFLNNSLRNYQYLVYSNYKAIIIDPLRVDILNNFINQNNLELNAILITHQHGDHIAGVNQLVKLYPNTNIYAYTDNSLFKPNVYVKDNDVIDLYFTSFKVLYTPGHTVDHVSFLFEREKMLFCGDTLFNAGVGNINSKTANIHQLYESLIKILSIDINTNLYPSHDYWQNNLDFALSILPKDYNFIYYREKVSDLASEDKPIVNLGIESKLNIFIRSMNDYILKKYLPNYSLGKDMFIQLRKLKNNF